MASTTYRLGIIEPHENFSGTLYTGKWYVANSDILSYTFKAHDDCSILFGVTCYVYDLIKIAAGTDGVIVKITAYAEGYSFGGGGQIPLQNFDKVKKSYDVGQFYWSPDFWGMYKADDNDVKSAYYNYLGSVCKKGDWMFPGATTSSTGTPLDKTPFDVSASVNKLLAQSRAGEYSPVSLFKVKFYTTKNINYMNWIGKNGTIPASMAPQVNPTGYWQAVSQKTDEVTVKNTEYNLVSRVMRSTPLDTGYTLTWYGAAWTW